MLTLLVKNISCLSSDDFEVEVIRDFGVAVVKFKKYMDVMKFVDDCAKDSRVKQLTLSARLLEMTKTIRVENLPPSVDEHHLKIFFENPQNGWGRVVNVECFPDESSALVEFFDKKVLDNIMTKKLELNNMPLSVFPYYTSLGTALYRKKPHIKLPAPFKEILALPVWKFLQKRKHLIEEINEEMRQYHCELTWSKFYGEVTIRPVTSLLRQERNKIQTWQKDTSTAFTKIMSRYKVTSFELDKTVWSRIKNDLHDRGFFVEFNAVLKFLNVVGESEEVQHSEKKIKELIEITSQKLEREQPIVKEKVTISSGKYSLLCHSGVLKHLCTECPEVEMFYDEDTQHMCLKGLLADVYKIKCDILEKVLAMAQKSLQVSPEVFQFLQEADCAELSKSLFIAQKIFAVYELNATTVLLTSCSPETLIEAEKKMVSALISKHIDVEDNKVLSDKKWKALSSSLWKKYNSSSKTVLINELTSGSTSKVIIVGCVRAVNEVHGSLSDFLEKHKKTEKLIELNNSFVFHYLKDEMKLLWQEINKTHVQVFFNPEHKENCILLTGPKTEVLEATNLVTQACDSVCFRTIQIDKPGARQFFQNNAHFYRTEVKNLFGCFVQLLENEAKAGGVSDGQKCFSRITLPSGISLIVQQGNLTQFPVEIVVFWANENLKHDEGLAAALLKAAGPELQADCDQIVKTKGKILPGSATISKAGKLPYRHVIHAVGPQWKQHEAQKCEDQLMKAVKESLHLAEEHKYRSIAIPAISSGNYGFPLPQCVVATVMALRKNLQQKSDTHTLKEIYLVDTAEKTLRVFAAVVQTLFKDALLDSPFLPSSPTTIQPNKGRDDGNKGILWTPEGLRILLVKGDVQNAQTDVVVNSVPWDLALNKGPLSQALLNKAGPKLQEELNTIGRAMTINAGTIFLTSGYNLHCSYVFHVVAPDWNKNSTSAYQIMEAIIRECLDITESLSLKSVTFPAIGTGTLQFPKSIFAGLIISQVFKFSSECQTNIQEVQLVLHPDDHGTIQAFSDEFAQRTNGNFSRDKISQLVDTQGVYGAVSSPTINVYEMKIGPITFQVSIGDITNEVADVIVNSTSNTFDFKTGLSKAILEGAGKNIKKQFSLLAQQGNSGYIVTDSGLLKSKKIIHVIGDNDVKKSVTSVLQECENRNYSSICLPAIGTGHARQNPHKVADAIINAIEDFIQKGCIQSVRTVKVVIFQHQLLSVFYEKMKKREGSHDSHQQSLISETPSFLSPLSQSSKQQNLLVLEEKKESTVFLAYGENVELLEGALFYIQKLIESKQSCYTNKDECIKNFDEKEYQELNELQKNLSVAISLDTKKSSIEVLGTGDVTHAKNKIEEMIKRVRAKEQELQADWISEFIEWQYNENNKFHCFGKITNLLLEEARKANRKAIEVQINHQTYKVDLNTYTATNAQGHTLQVKRLTKSEVEIPAHWSDMRQQNVLVVALQPSDPEYMAVANKFNQTCANFKIKKIERIQNTVLWNSYQVKKRAMDAKNGQMANEKLLFHGTDADSVPYINTNGFNRSYAGRNAAMYGKGTYFAVNARYSSSDIYSKPDKNGKKRVYYVRVLTGMFTLGHQSLLVPPPKNPQNPTDLYDTVTDNVQNPNLFVVFYDCHSYPEYLITFRQ
ncbi:protein mono-ADP-ribosyltransferase PARP14-like [Erinaceus europaeus]|uniref:Poly [ADP-ribose] polymerase n=1 Tax=Erinaceus europaeus TaxID=9365 RepID=A0A1S3AD88_ERIEU|nr:protein mono-ADP-ribosyltransferase PARP14-like [Erinaceus europaeus]